MSDSPWAKAPNPVSSSKPPNWGFYLLVNLGIGIGAGVAVELLAMATQLRIPDIAVNLAALYATVMIAGGRYLKSNGYAWTRQDRQKLAMAYTMVNLVVSVIVLALAAVAVSAGYGEQLGIPPEVVTGEGGIVFLVVMAIVIPLVLWGTYGLTRWILWQFVNRQARAASDVSDAFS